MTVKTGISKETPDRIIIDAGAVYLDYGLATQRLLGATRGGNEFNLNRTSKNIEIDGLKGAVKGLKRIVEVNPQITANLLELSVDNLIAAIGGANQSDRAEINLEHIAGTATLEFDLAQNNVVENSEKIYVKGPSTEGDRTGLMVLQNRSKKYPSRFVGGHAADNKNFVKGVGDWVKGHLNDVIDIEADGYDGNCMRFTAGDDAVVTKFLNLPGGNGAQLTNLVIGQHYRLQIALSTLGKITEVALGAAGTGYTEGDILTIVQTGGSGGTVRVDTVDDPGTGVITGITLLTEGSGYTANSALPVTGGTGEDATITITVEEFTETITVACDAGSKADIAPAPAWVVYVIEFIATGIDASISLTSDPPPAGDILYVSYLELERVDYPTAPQIEAGQVGYVMNWADNGSGKASVIFMSKLTTNDDVLVNYTYELSTPGDHTVITGGEIEDSDYIDNVAIVGNVSGKSKPVICMAKNALADTGFSLATAPRDEAVPAIIFTGHYDPDDLDAEPWEIRWPNS